ncbi:MAG: serine protease, partial [Verrucomicrobiota bacterium]
MKRLLMAALVGLFGLNLNASARNQDVRETIVKIYAIHSKPDYYNPWSMMGPRSSTGSGCIIKGKKILTIAHVVSDQTFIQVRRYSDSKRYQARVISVSHMADLAILTVDDESFFADVEPLELGELPLPQDEVVVYGFPLGGDTMSTTKGVVSRIEHQRYAHSSVYLLAGQIDAAINPGNSGGPVLKGDKIIGVAMQAISKAENIGYVAPVNVVKHFMEDLEDKTYDGFPGLGVVLQDMENP